MRSKLSLFGIGLFCFLLMNKAITSMHDPAQGAVDGREIRIHMGVLRKKPREKITLVVRAAGFVRGRQTPLQEVGKVTFAEMDTGTSWALLSQSLHVPGDWEKFRLTVEREGQEDRIMGCETGGANNRMNFLVPDDVRDDLFLSVFLPSHRPQSWSGCSVSNIRENLELFGPASLLPGDKGK